MYFDDCPHWQVTDTRLRELLTEFPGMTITRRLVTTDVEAEAAGFRGSPSVLVNGVDPFADPDAPIGLSCRVYRTPHGLAGSPTLEQLRAVMPGRQIPHPSPEA